MTWLICYACETGNCENCRKPDCECNHPDTVPEAEKSLCDMLKVMDFAFEKMFRGRAQPKEKP